MAKLFDGPRFMNDVTNELLKTPIAKETLGEAAGHAANFDVKKVASTLDAGLKKQMNKNMFCFSVFFTFVVCKN